MAELGERGVVAVGSLGKYKTAIQMAAIFCMLFDLVQRSGIYLFGVVLLIISAALTLWSMVIYLRQAWPRLSMER
jgi:CDP-diacylglycerol--glycerol-3-phosphate 3-phosphatidyltransferase